MRRTEWAEVGVIGVDSGRIHIGDHCYLTGEVPSYTEVAEILKAQDWPRTLQLNYRLGHPGAGMSIESGFGDGNYPVYVKMVDSKSWGRRVAEVKVVFIEGPDA